MGVAGLHLRNAGPQDLDAVVALERNTAEAPHWTEVEYAAIVNDDRSLDALVRRCLLLAESESRLIGFAVGKIVGSGEGTAAELESLVVEEATRRLGVGRALCTAVIAWSRQQGAEALELEVRAGSAGPIALYTGVGFVVAGHRRAYYREPVEDAVLMRLNLEKID
ncbi:MAG: GNAT family N-acetyltransferase [Edaphobacter sp.]